LDALRDRLRPFTVAGRPLLATEQPLTLLVLASHIGHEINSMRLMRLVEIVHVIRRDLERGALDWEALLDAMRRTGSARFMYPAFALAEYLAPGAVDHRIIVECWRSSNWAIRHTVRRLVPSGSSPDREGAFSLF